MDKTNKYRVLVAFLSVIILVLLYLFLSEKKYIKLSLKSMPPILTENYSTYKDELDSLLQANVEEAKNRINIYYAEAHDKEDTLQLSYLYYYKAIVKRKWGIQSDSAEFFLKRSIIYSEKWNNLELASKARYRLGVHFMEKHNYPVSLNYFLEAKDYFKKTDSTNLMLANIYNMLGSTYTLLGELEKGLYYHKKAYPLFQRKRDSLGLAAHYSNISKVYQSNGDLPKAIDYLKSSVRIYKNNKDTINWTNCLVDLSNTALGLKKYEEAKYYINQAYNLASLTKDTISRGHIMIHYGNIYRAEGNQKKALEYYTQGLQLAKSAYIEQIDLYVLKNIADIYIESKQYERAYPYINRYYVLKDSISGAGVRDKINVLQYDNELQQKQTENEIERQKYRNVVLIYTIVVLFFCLILLSFWFMYRNKVKSLRISKLKNIRLEEKVKAEQEFLKLQSQQHEREIEAKAQLQKVQQLQYEFELQSKKELENLKIKQFEIEMEAKNRELVGINLQLLSKNKLMDEIEEIVNKKPSNIENSFFELKKTIRLNRNQEEDWIQFKKVFEKIHPNFFEILSEKYSALTKTEIRICTYIKIKMAIDQISDLLNVSHQSVLTSRYRIRKKFQLKREEDLDEFIRNI